MAETSLLLPCVYERPLSKAVYWTQLEQSDVVVDVVLCVLCFRAFND